MCVWMCVASSFDFVFLSPPGNLGYFGSDVSGLGGVNPQLAFTTIEDGNLNDLFLDPIPGELFELPQALPSVEVWTNGIKATCETPLLPPITPGAPWPDAFSTPVDQRPCTYYYSAAMAASVATISSNTVKSGDVVTVTGTGFSVQPHVQLVSVANASVVVECPTSVFTATTVQCVVSDGSSGAYNLRVIVGTPHTAAEVGGGLTKQSIYVHGCFARLCVCVPPGASGIALGSVGVITYVPVFTALSPSSGSVLGGTQVR